MKNKILKDKRGGDKILSMYWIMILVIVAGGIFGMVYTFYNHPYDVRSVEAEILSGQIANCLSQEGKLISGIFEEGFEESFPETCNLNLENEKGQILEYYVEIDFYDSNNLGESVFGIKEGNGGILAGCNIQEEKEYKRESKCFEDEFFSFSVEGETNKLYLIKILSGVKKTEKNVI